MFWIKSSKLSYSLGNSSQKGQHQDFYVFNIDNDQKTKNGLNVTLVWFPIATPVLRNNCI